MMRHGLRKLRAHLAWSFAGLLSVTGGVCAQSPVDLKAQLDAQAREIQELKAMIRANAVQPATTADSKLDDASVKKIVDGYMTEKAQQNKAEAAAAKQQEELEGYKVGTDLSMTVRWKDGLLFETPHKDFYSHIGGWFQYDNVGFGQSKNLLANPPGGVGNYEDGDFFRRVRLQMDGGFWQVFEYNMIYGFENTQKSTISLFEFWGGIKDLPWVGMIRVGRMVTPNGLEGDDTTTNRAMTFFERSSMSEAFYQNFASGVWQGNSVCDQRVCYQSMFYYKDVNGGNAEDFFGDGEYCAGVRLTALPVWENEGRDFVHVGASFNWQHATHGGNELASPQTVRFRARAEQRDFSSDIDGTTHDGVINPGDSNRLVDTGALQADGASIIGTEFAWICGPFSLQAEYAWTSANNAVVNGKAIGDTWFDGGYVQASYFLTGENRTYDKKLGRFSGNYFAGPTTPFWLVRDENGGTSWGLGAWEVAARWSHLNLNGGNGAVDGGIMDGVTLGLNWYLNPNLKIQFEYFNDQRFHVAAGVNSGWVDGVGARLQVAF